MRHYFFMILAFFMMATLMSCQKNKTENLSISPTRLEETTKPTENVQNNQELVTSKEPIVISETIVYDMYQVQVVINKGSYRVAELTANPNVWYGEFSLRVLNNMGEVVSEEKLEFEDGLEMEFPYSFLLHGKDLNQDETIELPVGQYVTSNKIACRLYSIDKKGEISDVNIDGTDVLYIAGNEVSPEFEVTKDGKVKYQAVQEDRDGVEEIVEQFLVWKDNKFTRK